MPEKKKLGRPTDSPKRHEIKVRLDDPALETLDAYCKEKAVTRVQGIRDGINALKERTHKFNLTFDTRKRYYYRISKGGEHLGGAKMGRPTDNPKDKTLFVRLDNESSNILESYCDEKQVTKAEAARRGIKKLRDDLEQK